MNRASRIIAILITSLLCANFVFAEVLQEITVKEGQTLWSVANYYLKDPQRWPELLKYNKMSSSDPNVILPGIKLVVPMLLIKETLRAAHLVYVMNDVRYRRKAEAEWKTAATNMDLFNEDGLRTLQESRAKVKFPSGEILQLEENSLIILRPEKTREEIDLLSGGVRASQTKVLTSDTVVDPKIVAHGQRPDFRTKLKEDKTTLVEVYEGNVDVTAQGRTVTVNKGFGTEVRFRQPPSLARALPPELDMADISAPAGAELHSTIGVATVKSHYLELNVKEPPALGNSLPSPEGTKSKSKLLSAKSGVNRYHIQISSAPSFGVILVDELNPITDKARIDMKKYNLNEGTYYYHLSYVDDMGFEGKFSVPIQFLIDNNPQKISLKKLQDKVEVVKEPAQSETESKFKAKSESFATTSLGILSIAVIVGVILLILL